MPSLVARARGRLGQMTSDNLLARIVTLNIVGRAGYLIVGFGASVALARFLGAADRGLLALMVSTFTLGFVFTTFGLPLAALYSASRKDTDQAGLLGNSLIQAMVLAAVLIPLGAIFYQPLADAFGESQGGRIWIIAVAMIPVIFLENAMHAQLQGMLMFGRSSALYVLSRVAYAIGIVLFVGVISLGVAGALIAMAIGSVMMMLGSLRPILARGRPKLDTKLWGRSMRYGLRVQIGSVFQFANGRLDVLIMQFFRPLNQVGYYAVAETIAELLITLAGAFQTGVMPLMSHYEGDVRAETTSVDSIRHYGILAAVATVGNAFFGPFIIYFAFGAQFHKAIAPMLILLPGIWFLGLATVIQGDLSGRGRPGLSSALAGLAAGVTVALDLALIPPLGPVGGALASDGAYIAYGIASLVAMRKVTGIPVRRLVLPTRADFAVYGKLLARAFAAVRRHAESSV